MELKHGRPESCTGREEREIGVYDLLDSLGIGYERVDHEAANTMEDCLAIEGVLGARICKNLFLTNRQQTAFYLLMMPGDKVFKTKELSAQIGSARLSFGSGEKMTELLNCPPGSASLMGLLYDGDGRVQLLVDADLLRDDTIGCHPCRNTSTLRLRTADAFGPFLRAVRHEMRTVVLKGEE